MSSGITPINNSQSLYAFIKCVSNVWTLSLQALDNKTNTVFYWGTGNSNSNLEWNLAYDSTSSYVSSTWNSATASYPTLSSTSPIYLSALTPISYISLTNGEFNHLYVTTNSSEVANTTPFETWDTNTVLCANFNDGSTKAGNTDILLEKIKSIKIKRRRKGVFEWTTLKEIEINTSDDLLGLNLQDSLIPSGYTFEYAIVPVLTSGIEGDYTIEEFNSQWNGIFITSADGTRFKLYNGVAFGGNTQNKSIGMVQPIGSRYPVIIQNGATRYLTGSISGDLYGYQFEEDRTIDRASVVEQTNDLLALLSSGQSLCITDWNGNCWIVKIGSNDNVSFNKKYTNGTTTVTINFIEQGQYDNSDDLLNNGFSNTTE